MPRRKLAFVEKLWILCRSSMVGVLATASDLGTMYLLMGVLGLGHETANMLSLLPGLVVMFFGNKYFAFEDHSRHVVKQGARFLFVEAWAFAINVLLFFFIAAKIHMPDGDLMGAILLRMACTSIVYFGFSFPFWTFIFHKTPAHHHEPAPEETRVHVSV